MTKRKLIFECSVGSHLYGTNSETSDRDYMGVFIPSKEDLLGLDGCPQELKYDVKVSEGPRNAAGDVDRKHFSLKRYFELALQGQPGQLELLFAPETTIQVEFPEWREIVRHRESFLSKTSIMPFVGFAVSQTHKAVIKGENLTTIRALIEKMTPAVEKVSTRIIKDDFDEQNSTLFGEKLEYLVSEKGFPLVRIAGRSFDLGCRTKSMLQSLIEMEKKYGTRSKAAAGSGYDFKSLYHAARLLSEAEELLLTGAITLPRPDAAELIEIKNSKVDRDWHAFLVAGVDRLKNDILPQSVLPETPNKKNIDELCISMLERQLSGK